MRDAPVRKWFWDHVYIETNECIVWPFNSIGRNREYGVIQLNSKEYEYVHVKACEIHHGPRPEGKYACHGPCHNTLCINYRHLSWQNNSQNQLDKYRDNTMPNRRGINNPNYKHGNRTKKPFIYEGKDLFS